MGLLISGSRMKALRLHWYDHCSRVTQKNHRVSRAKPVSYPYCTYQRYMSFLDIPELPLAKRVFGAGSVRLPMVYTQT